MRSIILTHSQYQDQEVIYPYHRLLEEGEVKIVAEKTGKIRGILGTEIEASQLLSDLQIGFPAFITYDLLVLPGGVKAMEKLRQNTSALFFVEQWYSLGKAIASLCSGAQMLISTRIPLKGHQLAAYPAMAVDVENAGAVFVNTPVVVSKNIISSPHYNHMAVWLPEAIKLARHKLDRDMKMMAFDERSLPG